MASNVNHVRHLTLYNTDFHHSQIFSFISVKKLFKNQIGKQKNVTKNRTDWALVIKYK